MTKVLQELPVVEKNVTHAQVHAYADAAGDHNPIHLDESFAKQTPFGRTIAHGMLVLAFISEMMTRAYGETWLTSGSLKVRFRAPVYIGQKVFTFGILKGDDSLSEHQAVVYKVGCRDSSGEEVISGEATLGIPMRGGACS